MKLASKVVKIISKKSLANNNLNLWNSLYKWITEQFHVPIEDPQKFSEKRQKKYNL